MPSTTSRMPASSGRTLSLYSHLPLYLFFCLYLYLYLCLCSPRCHLWRRALFRSSSQQVLVLRKIFRRIIIIVWFQDYYHHANNSNWEFFVFAMLLYEVSFYFISFVCSSHHGRKWTITPRRGYFSGLDLARGKGHALFFWREENLYLSIFIQTVASLAEFFNHFTIYHEDIPDVSLIATKD